MRMKRFHVFLFICTVLFIGILLTLSGQPKFNFRSSSRPPHRQLANVKHTLPLQCQSKSNNNTNWPEPVQSTDQVTNQLTVVIVTARPEFKRLPATLAALICHLDFRHVTEVMLLVPKQDVPLLEPYVSSKKVKYYPWPIRLVSDDILLKHMHTNSYCLQMMFKLFLAQIIQTEYYLILDSDCLALWPIHVEQLLYSENENHSSYRALYTIEGRLVHEDWWLGSEEILQIRLEACVSTKTSSLETIGVTPIILSRTISLRTLCRLQKLYGDESFLNEMANRKLRTPLGDRMWTEYTLYYLTARCTNLFDRFHFHYNKLKSSKFSSKVNLYGLSIWSSKDWTSTNQNRLVELIKYGLKWRRKEIEERNGHMIIDHSRHTHNLFTVLQGQHGVNPKIYHPLFYPLYIQYLQQQNRTKQLITILNKMSETLVDI